VISKGGMGLSWPFSLLLPYKKLCRKIWNFWRTEVHKLPPPLPRLRNRSDRKWPQEADYGGRHEWGGGRFAKGKSVAFSNKKVFPWTLGPEICVCGARESGVVCWARKTSCGGALENFAGKIKFTEEKDTQKSFWGGQFV